MKVGKWSRKMVSYRDRIHLPNYVRPWTVELTYLPWCNKYLKKRLTQTLLFPWIMPILYRCFATVNQCQDVPINGTCTKPTFCTTILAEENHSILLYRHFSIGWKKVKHPHGVWWPLKSVEYIWQIAIGIPFLPKDMEVMTQGENKETILGVENERFMGGERPRSMND